MCITEPLIYSQNGNFPKIGVESGTGRYPKGLHWKKTLFYISGYIILNLNFRDFHS